MLVIGPPVEVCGGCVGSPGSVGLRVAAPIRTITHQMQWVAEGKLDSSVPYQRRADEIGQLARALEVFRTTRILTPRQYLDLAQPHHPR